MNKLLLTLTISTLALASCKKDAAEASFTTEKDVYAVKESVQFTDVSENATSYYWNFGDGESSQMRNPGHTYQSPGDYIVTLQVQGPKKTTPSEFSKKIAIVDSSSAQLDPETIFGGTKWNCDSVTQIYYNCDAEDSDLSYSPNNFYMDFNDDYTVYMISSGTGNLCEYEIVNDSTIGFYEDTYLRIWTFEIDANRLTLRQEYVNSCGEGYADDDVSGQLRIQHFYKE